MHQMLLNKNVNHSNSLIDIQDVLAYIVILIHQIILNTTQNDFDEPLM